MTSTPIPVIVDIKSELPNESIDQLPITIIGAPINVDNKINEIIATKRFVNLLKSTGDYPDPLKISYNPLPHNYNLRPGLSFLTNDQNPEIDSTICSETENMRPYQKRPFACLLNNNDNDNSEDSDKHQAAITNSEKVDKEGEFRSKRTVRKKKVSRKQFRHHDIKIFTPKEYRIASFLKQNEPKQPVAPEPLEAVPVSKESITEDIVNTLAGQKQESRMDADKEENNNNNQNVNNNHIGKHHLPAIVFPTTIPRRKSMEIKPLPKSPDNTNEVTKHADMPLLQTENDPPEPQNVTEEIPHKELPEDEPQQIENEASEEETLISIPEHHYSPEPDNPSPKRRRSSESPIDLSQKNNLNVPRMPHQLNSYDQLLPQSTIDHVQMQFDCLNKFIKQPFNYNVDELVSISQIYLNLEHLKDELPDNYKPGLMQILSQAMNFIDENLKKLDSQIESLNVVRFLGQPGLPASKVIMASTLNTLIQSTQNKPNATFSFDILKPDNFLTTRLAELQSLRLTSNNPNKNTKPQQNKPRCKSHRDNAERQIQQLRRSFSSPHSHLNDNSDSMLQPHTQILSDMLQELLGPLPHNELENNLTNQTLAHQRSLSHHNELITENQRPLLVHNNRSPLTNQTLAHQVSLSHNELMTENRRPLLVHNNRPQLINETLAHQRPLSHNNGLNQRLNNLPESSNNNETIAHRRPPPHNKLMSENQRPLLGPPSLTLVHHNEKQRPLMVNNGPPLINQTLPHQGPLFHNELLQHNLLQSSNQPRPLLLPHNQLMNENQRLLLMNNYGAQPSNQPLLPHNELMTENQRLLMLNNFPHSNNPYNGLHQRPSALREQRPLEMPQNKSNKNAKRHPRHQAKHQTLRDQRAFQISNNRSMMGNTPQTLQDPRSFHSPQNEYAKHRNNNIPQTLQNANKTTNVKHHRPSQMSHHEPNPMSTLQDPRIFQTPPNEYAHMTQPIIFPGPMPQFYNPNMPHPYYPQLFHFPQNMMPPIARPPLLRPNFPQPESYLMPTTHENSTLLARALQTTTNVRKTPENATIVSPSSLQPEPHSTLQKDVSPKRVESIPSMQITMQPANDDNRTQLDSPKASEHPPRMTVIKNPNETVAEVEAPLIKQETDKEFLGWIEKINTNDKLKEKFFKVMGIPRKPLPEFIEISDSDDDEHCEVKTPIKTESTTTTPQAKKLTLSDYPVRISIPYSPEIEPISPVNNSSPVFTYPNATKEFVSAIKHKTLLTFGDLHANYRNKLTLNDNNIEELIPNGKLRYMAEQHAFLRYHDYAQAEMFLKSLESDEEFLTQADVGAIRKAYKNILDTGLRKSKQTELITLPDHVEFTEMECLEDVEKYILERQLVDVFVPCDFARFYAYVTGFQIYNKNPPISLRTFLTMYNTNRLMELMRKYLIEKGCGYNNLDVDSIMPKLNQKY